MASASEHVDLLVLGFGKGGKTLAATLGRRGKRVAMIEQSDQMYGGTCINVGCVPTKALVHDAEDRRPQDDPAQWYEKAITRKNTLTELLRGNNFSVLDDQDSVTVITGRGCFVAPHEVEVTAGNDTFRLTADTVVINTGFYPRRWRTSIRDILARGVRRPGNRDSRHRIDRVRQTACDGRTRPRKRGHHGYITRSCCRR